MAIYRYGYKEARRGIGVVHIFRFPDRIGEQAQTLTLRYPLCGRHGVYTPNPSTDEPKCRQCFKSYHLGES